MTFSLQFYLMRANIVYMFLSILLMYKCTIEHSPNPVEGGGPLSIPQSSTLFFRRRYLSPNQ